MEKYSSILSLSTPKELDFPGTAIHWWQQMHQNVWHEETEDKYKTYMRGVGRNQKKWGGGGGGNNNQKNKTKTQNQKKKPHKCA